MITRKDVAKYAGVSEATVSNVMNGKAIVLPKTREKVLAAVQELNYVPNQNARTLTMKRSKHIGIAIYETTNPYHMELAKIIEEYAGTQGFIISLFMLDNNMADKLDIIAQRRLDALINFMTNQYPDIFINNLRKNGTQLVNFNHNLGSVFENDYFDAQQIIMDKAKELGHKNIAYICSMDEKGFCADSRGKQWYHGCTEFENSKAYFNSDFNLNSNEVGYNLAKQVIKDGLASVVFCTNDLVAIGCMRAYYEAGIKVPQEVSVIGCDDIDIAKVIVPALTTITIDKRRQGQDIALDVISQITENKFVAKSYKAVPVFRESLSKLK